MDIEELINALSFGPPGNRQIKFVVNGRDYVVEDSRFVKVQPMIDTAPLAADEELMAAIPQSYIKFRIETIDDLVIEFTAVTIQVLREDGSVIKAWTVRGLQHR